MHEASRTDNQVKMETNANGNDIVKSFSHMQKKNPVDIQFQGVTYTAELGFACFNKGKK